MSPHKLVLTATAIITIVTVSVVPGVTTRSAGADTSPGIEQQIAAETAQYVNNERAARGLGPVSWVYDDNIASQMVGSCNDPTGGINGPDVDPYSLRWAIATCALIRDSQSSGGSSGTAVYALIQSAPHNAILTKKYAEQIRIGDWCDPATGTLHLGAWVTYPLHLTPSGDIDDPSVPWPSNLTPVTDQHAGTQCPGPPTPTTTTSTTSTTTTVPAPTTVAPPTTTPGASTTTTTTTTPPPVISPTKAYVLALYRDFLGQTPTDAKATELANAIDAGSLSVNALVTLFANSPEWATKIVQQMYLDILGRTADPGGLKTWTGQLTSHKRTVVRVAAGLYDSAEFRRSTGSSQTAWVSKVGQNMLGRNLTQAEVNNWIAQAKKTDTQTVAARMNDSNEARRIRIDRLYRAILHRPGDARGLSDWTRYMTTNGEITLASTLARSAEYRNNAVQP